ncbi:AAA family ATPase [Sulfurimonas sp. HSL1-2]|uniref:AAA family ATPase n=1 Tax=Thiomicrolovo zhangzhouensis TaxID=3131933 RepID=UPI0031F8A864
MQSSDKAKWIIAASAVLLIALTLFAFLRDTTKPISRDQLNTLIASGDLKQVVERESSYLLRSAEGRFSIIKSQVPAGTFDAYVVKTEEGGAVVIAILSLIIILGAASLLLRYWMKHRRFPGASVRSAQVAGAPEQTYRVQPVVSDVTFSDIGGISDVKEELEEIIDFLKNPQRYRSFGARLPKGVLLVGPPGVGKTMIAKAVAAEANAPFYYQSASSFVHIYVGMGAKRVSELFRAAASNAPAIIFIDEIDAVGKIREGGGNEEREATLNQLLTEMDGFTDSSGIIVIAATNKIEVLDPALLRAGRFDRRIFVDLPTPAEREAIIAKYLEKIPHSVDAKAIAEITVGFNGAALAALVNEAALHSLRHRQIHVRMEDILAVKDKVAYGKKRLPILNDEQKECRATYLAAKAVAATWFDLPFEKVMLGSESIRPALSEPLMRHEIESHVRMLLAGKIMCDIRYREHTSSAKDDINAALTLAKAMLFEYGMGDSLLPPQEALPQMLERLETETRALLEGKTALVDGIVDVLLERESISKEEIKARIDAVL